MAQNPSVPGNGLDSISETEVKEMAFAAADAIGKVFVRFVDEFEFHYPFVSGYGPMYAFKTKMGDISHGIASLNVQSKIDFKKCIIDAIRERFGEVQTRSMLMVQLTPLREIQAPPRRLTLEGHIDEFIVQLDERDYATDQENQAKWKKKLLKI